MGVQTALASSIAVTDAWASVLRQVRASCEVCINSPHVGVHSIVSDNSCYIRKLCELW